VFDLCLDINVLFIVFIVVVFYAFFIGAWVVLDNILIKVAFVSHRMVQNSIPDPELNGLLDCVLVD
jgi:hypothetical protein